MTRQQMVGILLRLDGIEAELFSQYKAIESVRLYLQREWNLPTGWRPNHLDDQEKITAETSPMRTSE